MPSSYVRKFAPEMVTGKSIHSLPDALAAEKQGYDYIIFGPVFRTASKVKYGKPLGLNKLRAVCEKTRIPVLAVGGITPRRAAHCIEAGASGVAVISAILKSRNIKKKVSDFRKAMDSVR
jgi:thiamine-phosphate diphosphorylase